MPRVMKHNRRRGTALVLILVCLIPLITCVALAIDLGLLMTARTQISDAADAAAMAGCRTLNGDSSINNNYANVLPTAQQAVSANSMLSTALQTSQVTLQIGRYTYNTTSKQFEGQFPGPSAENWSMVQATVSAPVNNVLAFSKIFNFSMSNIQATATAAHRPRDVAIILDYSGSMRFASLIGTPYSGNRSSNNPDSAYPTFGHYTAVSSAALQNTTFTAPYSDANVTTTTNDGRAPIVNDFYTSSSGGAAFSAASAGYATTPGGDNFLTTSKDTTTTYAQTAASVLSIGSPTNSTRDATFETSGYTAYGMNATFNGYTTGPGYYGKTFFIWPPDPRTTSDWRKLYLTYWGSATAMDDNSLLWDSSGNWLAPGSGRYGINYTAILNFIKNVGPNPFPSALQAGRILYYDSIPSTIDTSSWPPSDMNQRFWKDYIDYVLGVIQDGSGYNVVTDGSNGLTGYGADYTWGTVKITAKSSLTGAPKPYMHYGDNPLRPRLHFWFGPATMVDFLGNYNMWYQNNVNPDASRFCWWPGTCHESPMYACKLGIRAALTDIQSNHPNNLVSLLMFSTPKTSSSDTSAARFNRVRVGLSRNYANMQDSLWYPPATVGNPNATVRPYDTNNLEVPRAMGGTCYSMALMQAFNQFSANTSLVSYNSGAPAGDAGGNGRKGAQKVIIFETDGAPNTTATASLVNSGANNSYYAIRYNSASNSGEFPSGVTGYGDNASQVTTQVNSLCTQLVALDTANPSGYSTATKKTLIHCIGFGPLFDPSSTSASANTATLNQMQTIGNVTDGMPSYKIIYGTEASVIANLQQAFTKILQDGVQVSLIQ
jgi:Flp pilus assembly protein TadG